MLLVLGSQGVLHLLMAALNLLLVLQLVGLQLLPKTPSVGVVVPDSVAKGSDDQGQGYSGTQWIGHFAR